MKFRFVIPLIAALVLTACGSAEKPKPAELGPNVVRMGVRNAWVANLGGAVDFPLQIRALDNLLYVANSDGVVAAIDARTGGDLWRIALGTQLSAGVGSDGRFSAVVSRDNELIVLDSSKEIWRQKLSSVAYTAPWIENGRIFVLQGNRSVLALDVTNGKKIWQQNRTGEPLILGRPGMVATAGDTLLVGFNGRLLGMNPVDGKLLWEAPIANSRGTNEVERLVDLVSGMARPAGHNAAICVRAFQSGIGCVDTRKGTVVWSKPSSGSTGLDGDEVTLYGTESDGRIRAWRRSDGERLWTNENLRLRALSAPLLVGKAIVVGDNSGLLHFLSGEDGTSLNRLTTDGSGIVSSPVQVGNTVVAVTQRGGVFGFRPE